MTMGRAIALLVVSLLVLGGGIAALIVKVDSSFLSSDAGKYSAGARTGDQAATPVGSGGAAAQEARATLTAIARTLTATAPGGPGTPTARTPVPGEVSPVAIGQPVTVGTSTYTVLQVADPEPPGFFVTNPGMRRVAIEVRQEVASGTVRYSFGLFRIRDSAGEEHSWAITNSEPNFDSGDLAAGQSRTGWISFQIPEGRQPAMLLVRGALGYVDIVRLD
ncbi:MAG: DUF4352 domain-containing protein [Dehalococcoidia bacterium]|nr:DUF4352 domain-containing protein [Dehalococcoidia bacterium]